MMISLPGWNSVEILEAGEGKAAIALHCTGGTASQWKSLAAALAPVRRLLAPNLSGIGATSLPSGVASWLDQDAELVVQLCRWCGEPVDLIGHSYGGLVALKVACSAPGLLRSLVLIEPAVPGVEHAGPAALAILQHAGETARATEHLIAFFNLAGPPGGWDAIPTHQQESLIGAAAVLTSQIRAVLCDDTSARGLVRLDLPVLAIRGDSSIAAVMGNLEQIKAEVPGASGAVIQGAGHMLPVTHAREVNAIILRHLSRVDT